MPHRKTEELPQNPFAVMAAREMLVEQARNDFRIEVAETLDSIG